MGKRLTLAVMAAGLGRRFDGSKQWAPIGPSGEALLDYAIYDALRAGFERVVPVVREEHLPELERRMRASVGRRCAVDFVCQRLDDLPSGLTPPEGRVKPWGTGHAVWSCRDAVDGPFAIINADDFYGRTAFATLAAFLRFGSDRVEGEHALVGYRLDHTLSDYGTVSRGVCRVAEDGALAAITERHRVERRDGAVVTSEDGRSWSELPSDALVSMNLWGFDPSLFAAFAARFESFLRGLGPDADTAEFALSTEVGRLIADGTATVRTLATGERWFGITYREDLDRAREEVARRIAAGEYPDALWRET